MLSCLLENTPLAVTDFSIAFNFPRTTALEGEILRTVTQVTVTASGKCITDFLKPRGRCHPGNHVIKSSGAEVNNSSFLVSKVFYTDGEVPACAKTSCAKTRTDQCAALLYKVYLKIYFLLCVTLCQR